MIRSSVFVIVSTVLFLLYSSCFGFTTSGEGYNSCSNLFKCGDFTADYPFWGGDRAAGCGHSVLHLHCHDSLPTIAINEVTYRVRQINGAKQTLHIARQDYYDDGICVSRYTNSSFDSSILELAYGFGYIHIFYKCSTQYFNPLTSCSNEAVYATPANYGSIPGCGIRVDVPASDEWEMKPNQTLKDGFEMRVRVWDVTACETCSSSGGKCGYDLLSNLTTCYCPNRIEGSAKCIAGETSPTYSESGRGSNHMTQLKLGLPIAGALILLVILVGSLCYIRQRRKIKELDSESSSKNLTESPESKSFPSIVSTRSAYFGVQVFSHSELEQATNHFDDSRELGEGGFGRVYFGKMNDGRAVAVKRLYERNLKSIEQFMNEVEILARLRHPNLVTLYGCTSRRSRDLLIVYEYISNGTLADHIHGEKSKSNSTLINWAMRLNIAMQSAEALSYLHSLDIIHRDVKTSNILLDENFHVKVADFGLSRLFPTHATHVSTSPQGTPGYVDPEYHQCYQLTAKSDVYSFGVVLMELISSKKAVDTTRHRHEINLSNMAVDKIQNRALDELVDPRLGFGTEPRTRWGIEMASELAFLCLQQDKDLRPTMEDVVLALKNIMNEPSTTSPYTS